MCVLDERVDLQDGKWEDIHVTAGALKMFFRELPEPLFTSPHLPGMSQSPHTHTHTHTRAVDVRFRQRPRSLTASGGDFMELGAHFSGGSEPLCTKTTGG